MKYSEEYTPATTGNLNISVTWDFNCLISGAQGGGVSIDVRIAIFDSDGYDVYFNDVYNIDTYGNETDISGRYSAFTQFPTEGVMITSSMPAVLLQGYTYNVGVRLRVILDGVSSIHGRNQNNPAVLKVQNMTIMPA